MIRFSKLFFLLSILFIAPGSIAFSQQQGPDMAWPLCGRITENPLQL